MTHQEALDGLLAEVEAALGMAEEDIRHGLRWGWRPGSLVVRHHFAPVVPYAGLSWWLDASATTFPGISRSVYKKKIDLSSLPVEKLLHDAFERLEREQ